MNRLALLLGLAACGDVNVKVSGNATVTHKIDLAVDWFEDYCTDLHPNDEQAIQDCVEELTVGLIDAMNGT